MMFIRMYANIVRVVFFFIIYTLELVDLENALDHENNKMRTIPVMMKIMITGCMPMMVE
jgi:hypothetical protein